MQFIQWQVCDGTVGSAAPGAIIPNAKAEVFLAGTGTLAALFDQTGASISNPVIGSTQGVVGFAANDGKYDVQPQFPDGSSAGPKWQSVQLFDASGVTKFVTPQQFGAVGDGVTDDSAAFVAAIAYLKSIAGKVTGSDYKSSQRLYIPAGSYYLGSTTLDITHTLVIEGEGGNTFGAGGGAATMLTWAANTTAFRFQAYNTSSATTVDGTNHFTGAYSTLRQLYICGPVAASGGATLATLGLTEGEYYGVHAKAIVFMDNIVVEGFQGDAYYAHTTIGGGSPNEGQSNLSRAYNCTFRNSRNGASISGGDSNAQSFIGCSFMYNRACGVDDQSFLGNAYYMCHAAGNGIAADNVGSANFPAYVVSNGGNRYCPVQGMESTASTTAPTGTADTSVWYYLGAGGSGTGVPAWTSGISLRCGAPYRTNNGNASNKIDNCYEEGGQGFSQYVKPTEVIGGTHGQGSPRGTAAVLAQVGAVWGVVGDYSGVGVGAIKKDGLTQNLLANDRLEINHPTGGQQTLEWFNGDLCWTILRSSNPTSWSFQILGEATTNNVGKRHINFPNGFGFANQKVFPGTAAPGSGTYVSGDRIKNTSPTPTNPREWFTQSGGSPGTWYGDYPYLRADPTTGIGYVTGAGAAVTQATNRTTGVTINKVCGQITLVSAAGSTSWQTMTVTNSAVAATDLVRVNQASGTDKYQIHVTGVRAGAFDITFATTGGTTTEQPVFNFAIIKGANS